MRGGDRVYSYRLFQGEQRLTVPLVGVLRDGGVEWIDGNGEMMTDEEPLLVEGDSIVRSKRRLWFRSISEAVSYHDVFHSSWAGRILREGLEHLDAVVGLEV